MSRPDIPRTHYGRDRVCAQCGTRVAQKAETCFFCGAALDSAPRRQLRVPWADLFLFAAIAGVLILWWVRGLEVPEDLLASQSRNQSAALAPQATPAAELLALVAEDLPTATPTLPPTVTPVPTLTPAPTTPTATPAPPTRYKVERGDTVIAIAQKFGSTVRDIIQTNELSTDGRLSVGQELIIPVAGPMGGGATATPTPESSAYMYVVKAGDTISTIATRYGSRVDWILTANKMSASDVLRIGQALLIPRSNETPTPEPTAEMPAVTMTPTPEPVLDQPVPLSPGNGSIVASEGELLLSWTSVGILEPDQYYVVTLKAGDDDAPTAVYWTKSTTWRLPSEYRGTTRAGVDFTWRVQVRHGSPEAPGQTASPPSEQFRFTWQ